MDNIQLCYIDNEINKIDKMKQGDVIYKNGMELLVVLSYDHNEPCKGCFFYKNKACGSEKLIKCWDCKKEYIFTAIRKYNTTELCGIPICSSPCYSISDNRSPEEKHEEEMRFCKDLNDLRCEMLIDMAKKIEEYLL